MTETETEILRSKTILKDVVRAYVEYSARQIYSVFEAYGYCVTCKNDKLYLFIEKGKLADLKVEEADMYNFYLATKRGYESADVPKLDDTTEGECVKDEVIGFAFEKFHFDTLQDNFEEIKDDKDIIRILNETISVWQYTYDALVFTFYYEGNIEENIFESMNYVQLKKLDYPLRVVVVVKYEDIDVEILRELSQKEEVKSIHVSMPFNSAADED